MKRKIIILLVGLGIVVLAFSIYIFNIKDDKKVVFPKTNIVLIDNLEVLRFFRNVTL